MYITLENRQKVQLSKETEEQLLKALKNDVKLRPENKEGYYYILSGGDILEDIFFSTADEKTWDCGNGFFTEEEAEKEVAKRKAIQSIKDFIKKEGMYFEPDWNDEKNHKFDIFFGGYSKTFQYGSSTLSKNYSPFGYLKSREDAQKVIDNCEKELKVIFDIKQYD